MARLACFVIWSLGMVSGCAPMIDIDIDKEQEGCEAVCYLCIGHYSRCGSRDGKLEVNKKVK